MPSCIVVLLCLLSYSFYWSVLPYVNCSSSVYVTQVKGIALRTLYAHACCEIRAASGIAETKRDGTRAETRIGLSAKWTSPFKSVGGSVQLTTGSWGVEQTSGYPLHSPLSPSLPHLCVTVCHHVSFLLYYMPTPHVLSQLTQGQVYFNLQLAWFGLRSVRTSAGLLILWVTQHYKWLCIHSLIHHIHYDMCFGR